jgi:putative membrane protein
MMGWNNGGGMGSLGWLGMGVFWLVLLGLIVWLVVRLLPDTGSGSGNSPSRSTGDSALDILDRRLANGQLDLQSWQAQRAALLGVQDVKK